MAKAQFQKHQRVFVEAVGCWAVVERIIPIWVKSFDEPAKITYDVGLGREFHAHELRAEAAEDLAGLADEARRLQDGAWRVLRLRNKWQAPEDCAHHPFPGSFPVVVTDRTDWGGWRTPAAEYDRDPERIEAQARLIAAAPQLVNLVEALAALDDTDADISGDLLEGLCRAAKALMEQVRGRPLPSA